MTKRQAKRVRRNLSAEEKERWQTAQAETERDKDDILAQGRRIKTARKHLNVVLCDAFQALKAERQKQKLSLADVEERTGIGRGALSRLENDADANPTMLTLNRYAQALGKTLVVHIE